MKKSRKQEKKERLEAFETLVSTYEAPLLRYASRVLGCYDTAQDVVQDTFIRLVRKWRGDLTPGPAVSGWLYRVAHNCAIDYLRKDTRRRQLHDRHSKRSVPFTPADRGTEFRLSDEAVRAARVLRTLSLREQQLVSLKVYDEKTYREISRITGLSIGNVGYILHHAMKKMAAAIRKVTRDEQAST